MLHCPSHSRCSNTQIQHSEEFLWLEVVNIGHSSAHSLLLCHMSSYIGGLSYFVVQICRVEDIIVEGFVEGSVVHFHLVRTVVVKSSGAVSASGLGT